MNKYLVRVNVRKDDKHKLTDMVLFAENLGDAAAKVEHVMNKLDSVIIVPVPYYYNEEIVFLEDLNDEIKMLAVQLKDFTSEN